MSGTVALVGLVFGLPAIILGAAGWRAFRAWRSARGVRLVTCPETHRTAAVSIDAGMAAYTAFVDGEPSVHLASCSRWATRERCDEPCIADVRANGRAAAVETIAFEWYDGKSCALCGRTIMSRNFVGHHPALLGSDGTTIEWSDVKPEQLPESFRQQRPICWDCHVAEHFRHEFPQLVVDRPTAPDANP